jgi:hypothetical protein
VAQLRDVIGVPQKQQLPRVMPSSVSPSWTHHRSAWFGGKICALATNHAMDGCSVMRHVLTTASGMAWVKAFWVFLN